MRTTRRARSVLLVAGALALAACGSGSGTARVRPTTTTVARVAPECRPGTEPKGSHHAGVDHGLDRDLTRAECTQLQAQLAQAAAEAARYPTLASAVAAGWKFVAAYVPGTASHWWHEDRIDATFDPGAPEYLLFGGDELTSRLVGFAYGVRSATEPQMFVGPNDHPHQHAWCDGPNGEEIHIGMPGCTAANAHSADLWFEHLWIVPGRSSPYGVFSSVNPYLTAKGWDPEHPIMAVPGHQGGSHDMTGTDHSHSMTHGMDSAGS